MSAPTKQPQVTSKHLVGQYPHGELVLNVYGTFSDEGAFDLEAVAVAGAAVQVDIASAISDALIETITGWAEFMAPAWRRESAEQQHLDHYLWTREMAVAF